MKAITLCVLIFALAVVLYGPGCVYLPRVETIFYKSVVVQDSGKARDIMAEPGSVLEDIDVKLGEKAP